MSAWVLIVRGFECDDDGIREVEARIKDALPEHEPRCTTVRESLYDALAAKTRPFTEANGPGIPEHYAGRGVHVAHKKGIA